MRIHIGQNGGVNWSSESWIYGVRRGTSNAGQSGWTSSVHSAMRCMFSSVSNPSWTGNNVPDIAPPPSYDGYKVTFEVGENELANTFAGSLYTFGMNESGYGWKITQIDMMGTWRATVNFGDNTSIEATGQSLSDQSLLEVDINDGNGFVSASSLGSFIIHPRWLAALLRRYNGYTAWYI